MGSIFLSASVPIEGRGNFYETANPFLIQFAVREFLTVCLGRRHIVWGGHPAITPMVWSVCEDLGGRLFDSGYALSKQEIRGHFSSRESQFSEC